MTKSKRLALISILSLMILLACRLPNLPILNRATETPIPQEPTLLPTEPPTLTPTSNPPGDEHLTTPTASESSKGTEDTPLDFDDEINPDELDPPLESWHDLPVMGSAIGGKETESGYVYFVEASLEEIGQFYAWALAEKGYEIFTASEDDPETWFYMYYSGNDFIAISIVRPEGKSISMVVMVQE